MIGKTLAELKAESGSEEPWIEAIPGLKSLGQLLTKDEGPFFMG
jgi:hypothetical protein